MAGPTRGHVRGSLSSLPLPTSGWVHSPGRTGLAPSHRDTGGLGQDPAGEGSRQRGGAWKEEWGLRLQPAAPPAPHIPAFNGHLSNKAARWTLYYPLLQVRNPAVRRDTTCAKHTASRWQS